MSCGTKTKDVPMIEKMRYVIFQETVPEGSVIVYRRCMGEV